MLYSAEIPKEGEVLTVNNYSAVNTSTKSFSVVSLINAIKLDALKSSKGLLTNQSSSIKSVLLNGVDKSSSEFNNAGIKPNSAAKTDYSLYYIGGGLSAFLILLIIIIARKK